MKNPNKRYEADEQSNLIEWCNFASGKYPELKLIFHIPNGGSRNTVEAVNLKRQGVKAGVPDLFLPVSRKGKHGLFIEMKVLPNKCTEKQKEWLTALAEQGYRTTVCFSFEQAKDAILEYLGVEK